MNTRGQRSMDESRSESGTVNAQGLALLGEIARAARRPDSIEHLEDDSLPEVKQFSDQDLQEINIEKLLDFDSANLDITSVGDSFDNIFDETEDNEEGGEDLIMNLLSQIDDIAAYTKQASSDLVKAENDALPDYLAEAESMGELYLESGKVEKQLEAFEQSLVKFQQILFSLNADIRVLQEGSVKSSNKVNNRRGLQERVGKFISDIELPKELIKGIMRNEINDFYINYLKCLSQKIAFSSIHAETKASNDVNRKLRSLKHTALEKVGTFLTKQISLLGSSKSIEKVYATQHELTNLSDCYKFIFQHAPDLAMALLGQYADAMVRFYSQYCSAYAQAMSRCQMIIAQKIDVIGIPEEKQRSFFTSKNTKMENVFSFGKRWTVLYEIGKPPLPPNEDKKLIPYEVIFRSTVQVLVDFALQESVFIQDFFLGGRNNTAATIFQQVSTFYLNDLKTYLSTCYDTIGIGIMICLVENYSLHLQRRGFDVLRFFLTEAESVLSTRFIAVFTENVTSVRSASAKSLGIARDGPLAVKPHYVTRRYAEFVSSNLSLVSGRGVGVGFSTIEDDSTAPKEKVWQSDSLTKVIGDGMTILRFEFTHLLQRLSEPIRTKMQQNLFLLNNYNLIINIITEHKIHSGELIEYQTLLEHASDEFVASQLASFPCFDTVITFISEYKDLESKGKDPSIHSLYTKEGLESLLKSFHGGWQDALNEMKATVLENFYDFNTGSAVFKKALEVVFENYRNLTSLILGSFKELRFSKFFVPDTQVKYDMRHITNIFD